MMPCPPSYPHLGPTAPLLRSTASLDRNSTSDLNRAIARCRDYLLSLQDRDGFWVGELEGDTILESEYILLMAYLGRQGEAVCTKAARYLLNHQGPHGGWAIYPGGPLELSASVKAYFALKLVGHGPEEPELVRARAAIQAAGGASRCNSFTNFFLALLGQIPYERCPAVPPEMILLPEWAPFNLSEMSAWTRTIVVPLSIFYAYKPVRRLAPEQGIGELFLDHSTQPDGPGPGGPRRWMSWGSAFRVLDRVWKWSERWTPEAWRTAALERAERWMVERFSGSDGLGAIFPPMVFTIIALKCLGYSDDAPEVVWAHQQLHGLILEDADSLRFQPCKSPIWDTAISAIALHDAGLPSSCRAIQRAGDWLLSKEVRTRGDWSVRRPGLEASGWYFEFRNEHYPDIDDTTMVLLALDRVASPKGRAAIERAVRWVLGMQNRDGGWAAFDVDVNREILTHVPFADHNAMLDPSCADITGRVLEVLGTAGYRPGQPAVDRAVAYLMASQEPEGCWYGRWGVNYIYGTWQVFVGLDRAGFDMTDPRIRRGVEWLRGVQQPCGGWGESCASYDDPSSKGRGIPTASQTAWAVLALLAAGEREHPAVERGIRFLLRTQQADGSWSEDQFTGTGFPRVFYLKYHLYRVYFPLMALARYAACTATPAGVGSGLTSILRTERRAAESPAHFECAGGPLWAGTFERDRASAQRSSVFFS